MRTSIERVLVIAGLLLPLSGCGETGSPAPATVSESGLCLSPVATYCDSAGQCTVGVPTCGDICCLPADSGPCKVFMPRWYFDAQAGECLQFVYGGCQGNKNNFQTASDCAAACGSAL